MILYSVNFEIVYLLSQFLHFFLFIFCWWGWWRSDERQQKIKFLGTSFNGIAFIISTLFLFYHNWEIYSKIQNAQLKIKQTIFIADQLAANSDCHRH